MKRKTYAIVQTKDGHKVTIERKRTFGLLFKFRYFITIHSKDRKDHYIYGWSTTDIMQAEKEIKTWTVRQIFLLNPSIEAAL